MPKRTEFTQLSFTLLLNPFQRPAAAAQPEQERVRQPEAAAGQLADVLAAVQGDRRLGREAAGREQQRGQGPQGRPRDEAEEGRRGAGGRRGQDEGDGGGQPGRARDPIQ